MFIQYSVKFMKKQYLKENELRVDIEMRNWTMSRKSP